jgi:hypothetical protein
MLLHTQQSATTRKWEVLVQTSEMKHPAILLKNTVIRIRIFSAYNIKTSHWAMQQVRSSTSDPYCLSSYDFCSCFHSISAVLGVKFCPQGSPLEFCMTSCACHHSHTLSPSHPPWLDYPNRTRRPVQVIRFFGIWSGSSASEPEILSRVWVTIDGVRLVTQFVDHLHNHDSRIYFTDHLYTQTSVLSLL